MALPFIRSSWRVQINLCDIHPLLITFSPVKKYFNHQKSTCTRTDPPVHILIWCLRIPFCMWNDHKVKQCWEMSQWNFPTDDVGEGLKLVWLYVIYYDIGLNKMELTFQIAMALHRHVDTDSHRTCWQCNWILVARVRAMSMQSET